MNMKMTVEALFTKSEEGKYPRFVLNESAIPKCIEPSSKEAAAYIVEVVHIWGKEGFIRCNGKDWDKSWCTLHYNSLHGAPVEEGDKFLRTILDAVFPNFFELLPTRTGDYHQSDKKYSEVHLAHVVAFALNGIEGVEAQVRQEQEEETFKRSKNGIPYAIRGQQEPNAELLNWLIERGTPFSGFIRIIKPDLALVTEERSEHGGYGGVGRFDQLHVWYKGVTAMQEWQTMDRYGSDRCHFERCVGDIGSVKVEEESGEAIITVQIFSKKEKKGRTREVRFALKGVPASLQVLSEEAQRDFTEFFQAEVNRIMAKLNELHALQPPFLGENGSPTSYWKPKLKQDVVHSKLGIGAFVTEEQIDGGAGDREIRYDLYVVSHNDKASGAKALMTDYGWEKEQGNKAIAIVNLTSEEIVVHGFSGQKTLEL